jgi:Holliday junction DNA helicase RuvA
MIGRVAGVLAHRGADHVLVDVRGVGYVVQVNDRTLAALPPVGEACALWTELLVRDDALTLVGFLTLAEKEWHRLLMTVQGVGAKAAMAILGALGAEGLARAVALGDQRAVQGAPGIGPKIASRVILELKGRAPAMMALAAGQAGQTAPGGAVGPAAPRSGRPAPAAAPPAAAAEALSALVNLGYGQGEAAEAVARAGSEAPEAATPDLIRRALKALAPRG